MSIIDTIDKGLEEYYAKLGRNDYIIKVEDDDGEIKDVGRFVHYCDVC